MTEKQRQKYINGSANLFVTGAAGTGKSYFLNQYIQSHENVLVCASTGIAALNVGGDTIHKVFHVPVPAYESPSFAKGKKGALTMGMIAPIVQADTVIIDEISMARADVFSFLVKVLRKAEREKGSPIKLIVCGDFSQLPPVVPKADMKLLKKFGFDESGYAFTTQEWKSCKFKVIELTDIHRQEDLEFIQVLNQIRVGDIHDLSYFDRFVDENPNYEDAICICGTNAEAERLNQEYLDTIPGNTSVLQSRKEGRPVAGLIDDLIIVKEGCRIIFTANDTIHQNYKNGTFGVLTHIADDYVVVDIDGKTVSVRRREYPSYRYTAKSGSLQKEPLGKVWQYPFKLGKAITIHKSQGQTFDRAIISPEIFAAGQLYVALSRVTSPEGLTLLSPVKPEHVLVDSTVQKFYKNDYTWTVKKPVKKAVSKTSGSKSSAKSTAAKKSAVKKTTRKTTRKSSTKSSVKKSSPKKSSAKSSKSRSTTRKKK